MSSASNSLFKPVDGRGKRGVVGHHDNTGEELQGRFKRRPGSGKPSSNRSDPWQVVDLAAAAADRDQLVSWLAVAVAVDVRPALCPPEQVARSKLVAEHLAGARLARIRVEGIKVVDVLGLLKPIVIQSLARQDDPIRREKAEKTIFRV